MSAATIRPALAGATAALAIAWAALAAPAAPAFAHNSVIDEGPKADSSISAQPGEVWIETNDALLDLDGASALDVIGPDGRHYATACPAVDGAIASVPAELGPAGDYTVAWRVVSADGHPITGDFAFEWAPADGEPIAEGSAEAACGAASGTGGGAESGGDAGEAGDGTDAAASGAGGDLIWIAGAVVAVLAAGVAAFVLTRRRPRPAAADDELAADGAEPSATDPEPRDAS